MKRWIWVMVVVLAILHYDFWWWNDSTLLFGFLPIGLGYHGAFSLVCGLCWALVVYFAWPSELEEWANETDAPQAGPFDGGGTL
jgi:hypothetical protein